MTRGIGKLDRTIANRAVNRLRNIRDEVEQAARPPGDRLVITRQQLDAVLDDLGAVARLICDMAAGA